MLSAKLLSISSLQSLCPKLSDMLYAQINYAQDYAGITYLSHRLQLSRNLRDSPGFVDFVPGPGGPSYLSRKVTD